MDMAGRHCVDMQRLGPMGGDEEPVRILSRVLE